MKNTVKNLLLTILYSILIISCSKDNNNSEVSLAELQNETTEILTDGNYKTWKLSEAYIISNNQTIDISDNFNIVDDEFVFSGTSTIEWRRGYEVNTNATTSQQTLSDNYLSPRQLTFVFDIKSSTSFTADNGNIALKLLDNNTITGVIKDISGVSGEDLNITLTPKNLVDYPIAPSYLNFTKLFTIKSNGIVNKAPGMLGSYVENSVFFANREDQLSNGSIRPERVIKFDLKTNSQIEHLSFKSDFVSKQLHIVNNQLICFGGQYVSTYGLDISNDPLSVNHNKTLSRFGSAAQDDNIFVIGGDLLNEESNKVYKWNVTSQILSEIVEMPEARSGARATIINNNLYVFGGSIYFGDLLPGKNTIYKIPLDNPSNIQTFNMSVGLNYSFVQRYQNLIYVAGFLNSYDSSGITGINSIIGVFDTNDNSFKEISNNLDQSEFKAIHQMIILNNKMYVLFGNWYDVPPGQFNEWPIYVAELN